MADDNGFMHALYLEAQHNEIAESAYHEINRLRAELTAASEVCLEAQNFIDHDKNCGAIMGRIRNCDCGCSSLWLKLNNWTLWSTLTKDDK